MIKYEILTIGVVVIITRPPVEVTSDGRNNIEQRPSNDDHIVDRNETDDHKSAVSEATEERGYGTERVRRPQAAVLSNIEFQEEYWKPDQN